MIKLLFFASYKEIMKTAEISIESAGQTTLGDLLDDVSRSHPALKTILGNTHSLIAVNHEFAEKDTVVKNGDEIAFIPPMSGGSGGGLVRIQREDFSVDDEIARIKTSSKSIGGIAVFLGTARDISNNENIEWLEFEHYPRMAEKQLNSIREQALDMFEIIEAGIVHRIGRIGLGENIVLIIAGAQHRKDAFAACEWCIDELKKITPIWKKEMTGKGEIWVEEHP